MILSSPDAALEYAKRGRVEEWVHAFLASDEGNAGLLEGLRRRERFWIGPVLADLSLLRRTCGPEPGMEFGTTRAAWDERTGAIASRISRGWEPAPLIAHYEHGRLAIRDGNHRHEALRKRGAAAYWTIVWHDERNEGEAVEAILAGDAPKRKLL